MMTSCGGTFVRRVLSLCAPLMALGLSLNGCADRAHNILCPNNVCAQSGPGRSIDMLVATTRQVSLQTPGEVFNGERSPEANFADVAVSIPPTHQSGRIEWPTEAPGDARVNFVATRVDVLNRAEAIARFDARIAHSSHRQALVFVHGFNNSFEEAVFRFAQLVHDGDIKALPVLFTWPSRAKIAAYAYDSESANYSRDALEKLLRYLVQDKGVGEISIVAHSMGNWVLLEALRQISIRDGRLPLKIKNVLLASPDVDYDVFRKQIQRIGTRPDQFTLFVARDDRALAASRCLHDKSQRLGAIDLANPRYDDELRKDKITPVDMSFSPTVDPNRHDRFASSSVFVRSLGNLVEHGQALQSTEPAIYESIGRAATGAVTAVGSAAGAVAAVPLSLFDPMSGGSIVDRVDDIGSNLCIVTDAFGDAARF